MLMLLTSACFATADSDLRQASNALAAIATDDALTTSCFSVVHPMGKASDFLTYLFSDPGRAEWPIASDEAQQQQMRALGNVPIPETVLISAIDRTQLNRKELVLQADDPNRMIQSMGYLAGDNQAVFTDEWSVGITQASPTTQHLVNLVWTRGFRHTT